MYCQFFGVHKRPFNLTSDPDCVYLTVQHMEALAGISYAILGRKGLAVLTGDSGTGKTTLLMRAMQHLPVERLQSSVIVNPTLSPSEFLEAAMMDFGLDVIPSSKAQRISSLLNFLWTTHRAGKISALIVDEAHKLSLEVLEEIRLLGNFESATEKLLQIVLVGQPELDAALNSEQLRQFKQRVALRMSIGPLAAADIEAYIQFRWTAAGGTAPPFSADAVACIRQATHGIPRLINITCDNALMEAFGEGSATVEARHILTVCRDLQLSVPVPPKAAAPPEPAPPPVMETYHMRTLERYTKAPARRSLLGRLRSKFGSMQGIETA